MAAFHTKLHKSDFSASLVTAVMRKFCTDFARPTYETKLYIIMCIYYQTVLLNATTSGTGVPAALQTQTVAMAMPLRIPK